MSEYFWKQYEDLPQGLGYMRFSTEHIITLLVLGALIVLTVRLLTAGAAGGSGKSGASGGSDATGETNPRLMRAMRVIPWIMVCLELFKDGFLVHTGHFGVGYLPLHLCSLGLFVFIAASLAGTDRWRMIWGEIACVLILPGTIAALLFPDWAHLYPVFNFMNLYGYAWHGMLLLYPILMVKSGWTRLSIRHAHYPWIFLICAGVPVYVFDRIADCNYMFVNWPLKGTPLTWIAEVTGDKWYLAGYAVFALIVIGLIYAGIEIYHSVNHRAYHGSTRQ